MINNVKNPSKYYILLLLATVTNLIIIAAIFIGGVVASVAEPGQTAYIKITVLDGMSGLPIEGASVCIPEADGYYETAKNGSTRTIAVPYKPNTAYDDTLKREWGDITILAYKEGYADFIIFYIMVQKDSTRHLTIKLFPSNEPQTHTLIESPDPDWVREFVNKYKK